MKKSVDQKEPRKFAHIKTIGNRAEQNRQRDIEFEN